MMSSTSRLPYLLATLGVLVLVGLGWMNRDRLHPVEPGGPAPSFTATDLEGNPASLEDYGGNVVLLNIWATWCPPCRDEMPSMQRLYEHFEGQPFEIVAVSVDAPVGQRDGSGNPGGHVGRFAEELGLTFPILHDPEQRIQRIYRSPWLPESFVIGKDGIIYRRVAGATEWDSPRYKEFIERLLAEEQ